jgi:Ricin-type beta-trefoil lectin domain-like
MIPLININYPSGVDMRFIKNLLCSSAIALFAVSASADVNVIWGSYANSKTSLSSYDGTVTKLVSADTSSAALSGNNIAFLNTDYSFKQSKAGVEKLIDTLTTSSEHSVDGNNIYYRKGSALLKYNGTSTQTLWDSGSPTLYPINIKGSGNTVVFQAQELNDFGSAHDYYIYDGVRVQNLNNITGTSRVNQLRMDVSGKNVVWGHESDDGTVSYIDFWDGRTAQTIKSSTYLYSNPKIDGNNVVFLGRKNGAHGSEYEIFLWDGATTKQITNSAVVKGNLQISGKMIVWQAPNGDYNDIYLWDGSKTIQLTTNALDDTEPQISNGYVVWIGSDGNDNEIFMWDGKTTQQLTNNTISDFAPKISVTAPVVVPEIANGTYLIQNKLNGKYLNRTNAKTTNGTLIQVWGCSTCQENKWIATRLADGSYEIAAINAPAQALDVTSTAEGAALQMWYFWGQGNNQKFYLVKGAAGTFYIAPLSAPGKVLEVGAGQTANGAKVVQRTLTATTNQQWVFVPVN